MDTCLPSVPEVSPVPFRRKEHYSPGIPIVSDTSACLLNEVAKVLVALLVGLEVRRAPRAIACRIMMTFTSAVDMREKGVVVARRGAAAKGGMSLDVTLADYLEVAPRCSSCNLPSAIG